MSDFNIRITLWSLVNKSVYYIKHPKLDQAGVNFSSDGKFMAVAERRECKDHVSIYDCASWQLCKHFPVDTKDLVGLKWSPDGRVICVWDSLLYYNLLIYSLDGRCLASYSAYEGALGIKSVSWSPTSQLLAVGSYDQKVRILNHITWKRVVEWTHPHSVEDTGVAVYCEVEKKMPPIRTGGRGLSFHVSLPQSRYETKVPPIQIASLKLDPEKANPKMGVGTALFSQDNRYLATINDNLPSALWIWEVPKLKCSAIVIHMSSIRCVEWDPTQSRLAICTGTDKLYFWSKDGCSNVSVPSETPFSINRLAWNPEGTSIVLMGKTHFCICHISDIINV